MLPVAVAHSSDDVAIRYVLPVLWMTMQGIGQYQRRQVCFVQFTRWWHRGRSLPFSTASYYKCRGDGEYGR